MAQGKAHKPTEETIKQVTQYAAVGISHDDIARVVGIDADTLKKHYRKELDTAATKANGAVGGALYNKCMSGDTVALIWWTKARMGWREQRDDATVINGQQNGVIFMPVVAADQWALAAAPAQAALQKEAKE